MKWNIEQLKLGETYSFNVVVDSHGTKFSGKLNLSPERCTLIVSGETSQDRHADFTIGNVDHLLCWDVRTTFILLNLKIINYFGGMLDHHPKAIKAFEISYEIEYVICTHSHSNHNARFLGFELDSSLIALWVGETKTQHEIISKFNSGILFGNREAIPSEFEQNIDGLGSVVIGYAASMHFSTSEFSAGVRFPPKFTMMFDEYKTEIETIDLFNVLRDFLTVVIGRKISIQVIQLISAGSPVFRPTLYFSEPKFVSSENNYVMFPLGCNPVRNDFGLPEFPLTSINAYFNATSEVRTYFKKYVKYRTLENPEEQFLGYFRLLEKLTSQQDSFVDEGKLELLLTRSESFVARYFKNALATKDLFRRIRKANKSKLNTASCITRFMKELPTDLLVNLVLGKPDIVPICQFRNDLIHANRIELDENDVQIRAKFIEVLLIFALFKTIGIAPESLALIVPRMHGYDWIRNRPDSIITV
ncbi:hypothetical protein FEMY_21820 [Ferrovum myxofaciens]|uniref:ApeA N-terminal domain-containing protein n=1 Tax=Ferrovum myxofaciens TaxID=416213 RepID=A0A149VVP3_9PROT|nr:hypothetical protein [Ferrovum myxofaciens]KXW57290.1 hypothetical protein FEMY_21820 [Ferrovum myxofaciens]